MRPRFRAFASVAALFALSASFAEGVWASTCGGMESMAESEMGEMGSMAMPMANHEGDEERSGGSEGDPAAPPCPLTAAIGSCTALSLPTGGLEIASVPTVRSRERDDSAVTPDLLFAAALLRPPKA